MPRCTSDELTGSCASPNSDHQSRPSSSLNGNDHKLVKNCSLVTHIARFRSCCRGLRNPWELQLTISHRLGRDGFRLDGYNKLVALLILENLVSKARERCVAHGPSGSNPPSCESLDSSGDRNDLQIRATPNRSSTECFGFNTKSMTPNTSKWTGFIPSCSKSLKPTSAYDVWMCGKVRCAIRPFGSV